MQFREPLIRGTLVRRYKRFLSDILLDSGETVTAHCANSGSMTGVCEPGIEVWLSRSTNPGRKLAYSWEMARVGDGLVGVNTMHPNALAEEAIRGGHIAELTGYASVRREVNYGQCSRIDLLLENPGLPKCFVEVKNVHLRRGDRAEFPDAQTARGTRHLAELRDMVVQGARAVMLYLVQRSDCRSFAVAADIDPAYAAAFRLAVTAGVEVLCYDCRLTLDGISIGRPLPVAS